MLGRRLTAAERPPEDLGGLTAGDLSGFQIGHFLAHACICLYSTIHIHADFMKVGIASKLLVDLETLFETDVRRFRSARMREIGDLRL